MDAGLPPFAEVTFAGMEKMLTPAQVGQYRTTATSSRSRRCRPRRSPACNAGLARYEDWLGNPVNHADRRWRSASYVMLPWVMR